MRSADHWRELVATSGDAIAAYNAVRRSASCWSHLGEIQLVVSAGWCRSGLGSALLAALLDAAHELEIRQVIVQVLEEQAGGRAIFERLGFQTEGVRTDHVQDQHSHRHNLLIISCQIC